MPNCRGRSLRGALIAVLLLAAIPDIARQAAAETAADTASRISEQSFALLTGLNSQSSRGSVNPLLGPIASFSSDAEILKQAFASGDIGAELRAAQTLAGDQAAVDNGLQANPTAIKAGDWNRIKTELNEVTQAIAKSNGGKLPAATAMTGTSPAAPVPAATAGIARTTSPSAPAESGIAPVPSIASDPAATEAPIVKIESRTTDGDIVRIKGFIEGSALKTAGIYENGQQLRGFKVSDVPGRQKLDLDIGIANPPPATTLRVTDASGRVAEAFVNDPRATASLPSDEGVAAASGPIAANSSSEGGVEVHRDSSPVDASAATSADDATNAVREIPSHAPRLPSPSKRHTLSSRLGDVQINVMGVMETATAPPTYEVVGQIDGRGVTRAGIYVDGRLKQQIPIEDGEDFASFDQRFVMNGREATIRAYGAGNQFTESSIDLSNTSTTIGNSSVASASVGGPGPMVPMARPASGIGVQITSVQPLNGNLYAVSGTISGGNIASAGLYQNGVLAQPIRVGGGIGSALSGGGFGLGSVIGALIPGAVRSTNFNLRFSPSAGYASIRAYDQTGAYTEQPVMAGPVNPYGVNPYGSSPYGVNPYGAVNPYGRNPNAVNPYATNPYAAPISPYTIGRPASRPLW